MSIELPPQGDDSGALPYTFEQILAGVAMGLIVLISLANVAVRYLTAQSFAATEEFSIALLIVVTFLGSSTAFALERHVAVTFFVDRCQPRLRRALRELAFLATAALFGFVAWTGGRLTFDQYRFEETSPALGVPQWWYTVWMPALAALIVLRLVLTRWRAGR
jgi:TRAP-type C4-dicarboxylate transport system permease small subunit